jgi:hypothetical protein
MFGVLKRRFRVLIIPQEYSLDFQACLVSALAVIHNFIHIHDPGDVHYINNDEDEGESNTTITQMNDEDAEDSEEVDLHADEQGHAADRREKITRRMWRDYRNRD